MKFTTAIVFILFSISSPAFAGSSLKNLLDIKCDEKALITSVKGHVERRKQELIVWLPGYFEKETGALFRDHDVAGESEFKYCGGTENYDLVFQNFGHDAPMLYLIESSGRKHRFHVGDTSAVYVSADSQAILSIKTQPRSTAAPDIAILRAVKEEQGSYKRIRFDEEFTCRISEDLVEHKGNEVLLSATAFNKDEVELLAHQKTMSSGKAALKKKGSLQLKRKDEKWKIAFSDGYFSKMNCEEK